MGLLKSDLRQIVHECTPAPRAGSWGISRSSPGASGPVAVGVRDAPGHLLMGLPNISPWLVAESLWSAPNTMLQRACRCRLAQSRQLERI